MRTALIAAVSGFVFLLGASGPFLARRPAKVESQAVVGIAWAAVKTSVGSRRENAVRYVEGTGAYGGDPLFLDAVCATRTVTMAYAASLGIGGYSWEETEKACRACGWQDCAREHMDTLQKAFFEERR